MFYCNLSNTVWYIIWPYLQTPRQKEMSENEIKHSIECLIYLVPSHIQSKLKLKRKDFKKTVISVLFINFIMKDHYQWKCHSSINSLTKRREHQCGSNQESKKQSIEKKAKPCPLSEPPEGKHHHTKQHT